MTYPKEVLNNFPQLTGGNLYTLIRGAGAAMGWSGPLVEALSGVFVRDDGRPIADDPGRTRA